MALIPWLNSLLKWIPDVVSAKENHTTHEYIKNVRVFFISTERRKVNIIYDFKVEEIIRKESGFLVKSNSREVYADQVILSTGSKACPKTGSDGSGYLLAESLGHTIHTISPALVQLIGRDTCFKEWNQLFNNYIFIFRNFCIIICRIINII